MTVDPAAELETLRSRLSGYVHTLDENAIDDALRSGNAGAIDAALTTYRDVYTPEQDEALHHHQEDSMTSTDPKITAADIARYTLRDNLEFVHPDMFTSDMTDRERRAVDRYATDEMLGLIDCFDAMDAHTGDRETGEGEVGDLAAYPGMLRDWWDALDELDGDGFDEGGKSETSAFARWFALEVEKWLRARRDLLLAIARVHGYDPIPVPDHHGGEIETNNRPIGHYGFEHLTGLG